jgi:AcrR family transcriptional regulator
MTSATPDPAPSRRERRRREIHERIIVAATGLFGRKGFTGTTALEIAETADVAEKTFYNHFPTKQHLIEELAQRTLEVTAELLADAREQPGTTVDRLRHFCERSADEAEKSREFTREVLLEVVRMAQTQGAFGHHGRLTDAIRAFFERGLAQGDIAPDRDVGFLTELGVAAYLGIIINWVILPNYPLRERLRQLADIAEELLANGRASSRDEGRR